MRVGSRVETVPVRIPMRGGTYEASVVTIREDGVLGLGEAPLVVGRPLEPALKAATEVAELDLRARAAGVPLAELLGGTRRTRIACNALILARSPAAVAGEVERACAAGFRSFKLKALDGGGRVDLERLRAARWGAWSDGELRLDFNSSFDAERAALVLSRLSAFAPLTVEQPLRATASVEEWDWLRSRAGVALAADESLAEPALALALAELGIGLAMKLATVGGPMTAIAFGGAAVGPAWVASSYETSIGLAAALHVACALPSNPAACGLATLELLEADLAGGLELEGGCLRLPEGPGLGVQLDAGALDRYRSDQ